ncbi:MAG TPA: hypothetical protein VGJ20_43410 [Xanthobacteraceae bacterium]
MRNPISPFTGEQIEALPISGRWLRGAELPDEPVTAIDGRLRVGEKDFVYERLGVRRANAGAGQEPAPRVRTLENAPQRVA